MVGADAFHVPDGLPTASVPISQGFVVGFLGQEGQHGLEIFPGIGILAHPAGQVLSILDMPHAHVIGRQGNPDSVGFSDTARKAFLQPLKIPGSTFDTLGGIFPVLNFQI